METISQKEQFSNLTPYEQEVKAQEGDAEAQYELGCKYEIGDGFPKDTEKAIVLFSRAAAQGHKAAQERIPKGVPTKSEKETEKIWKDIFAEEEQEKL